MAARRAVESTSGQQIVEHRLTDLFAHVGKLVYPPRCWDALQMGKITFELADEFGGREHLAIPSNFGAAPARRAGFGLAAKIALALAGVDTGAVVILLAGNVVDALAGSDADVALDVASAT